MLSLLQCVKSLGVCIKDIGMALTQALHLKHETMTMLACGMFSVTKPLSAPKAPKAPKPLPEPKAPKD